MKFLDEKAALGAISARARTSRTCDLAVAFWGAGAMDRLGLAKREKPATIICNLAMGGTNPAEIRALLAAGVEVRQADDLHAKVYVFDDAVILGSSNASSNGLAFQQSDGLGWREANILVEDAAFIATVQTWRTSLETRPVLEADLKAAEEAWRRGRLAASPPPGSASVLTMIRQNPSYFEDRPAYLGLFMDGMAEEADDLLEQVQAGAPEELSAYHALPDLPDEAHLLDFWIGERGGLTFDGYFERTPLLKDRPLPSGALQLCLKRPNVIGLHYHPTENTAWKQIAARVRQSKWWNSEHRCAIVPLARVSDFLVDDAPPASGKSDIDRFHAAMLDLCHRTFAETPYRPNYFRDMLSRKTGPLVAKQLLSKGISEGFENLRQIKRLDLSIEALVTSPDWSGLFDGAELAKARRHLSQAGFKSEQT